MGLWMPPLQMVYLPSNLIHRHHYFCSPHWWHHHCQLICWRSWTLPWLPQIPMGDHRTRGTKLCAQYHHILWSIYSDYLHLSDDKNRPTTWTIWPSQHTPSWHSYGTWTPTMSTWQICACPLWSHKMDGTDPLSPTCWKPHVPCCCNTSWHFICCQPTLIFPQLL